jgi:hypothetical protein
MGTTHIVGPQGQKVHNFQVRPECLVEKIGKEISIFEIGKHPQVNGNTQGHHDLFPGLFAEMINGQPYQVIRASRENEKQEKQPAGLVIKEEAYQEEVDIPERTLFIQDGIESKGHQQECPEIQPGKKEWSILVIKEYV